MKEKTSVLTPCLIKEMDNVANCEIKFCKKIQSDLLLVKTRNEIQAEKLISLIAFTNEVKVDVSLHITLNSSKRVIYNREIINVSKKNQKNCKQLINQKRNGKREKEQHFESTLQHPSNDKRKAHPHLSQLIDSTILFIRYKL